MDGQSQRDWVARVLGVAFPDAAPVQEQSVGTRSGGPLLPIWVAAKDATDETLSGLQRILRDDGNPDLRDIAEFGLNGVTDTQSVGMMVALRGYDSSPSSPKTRSVLSKASAAFRSFLDTDETLDLIEDNPFTPAPLRAPLYAALDTIDARLQAIT